MRSYDVAVASLAIGVPARWIDNVLSRHEIPGVRHTARGVTRRLSPAAIEFLEVVRILTAEIGLPVPRAVELARAVSDARPVSFGDTATLQVDTEAVARRIAARLPDAVDSAPRPRRGRPPRRGV